MVSLSVTQSGQWIVAEPNRSARWCDNRRLVIFFGLWFAFVGAGMATMGLWPIVPFLGLELIAVAWGLHHVCRKLRQRHVLRAEEDIIVIQKGDDQPHLTWRLPRATTSLSVEVPFHPWDALAIRICCQAEQIRLGEFLNKDDSRQLLRLLRAEGLPVRTYGEAARIDI